MTAPPVWHPSPNFGPRRDGALPDMVVLHYTGMDSCGAALERLCDPKAEVSAHYLISETGKVLQMVEEDMRAWHAGAGQWGGVTDVNSRSIGIELVNTGAHPFPEPQMAALERLLADIMEPWSVSPERVIGHSDMAPDRKCDPGPHFDWRRLARQGLSVWPDKDTAPTGDFFALAKRIGYPPQGDPDTVLAAFRLRFRPGAEGPVTPADIAMAADLARRFPVDRDAAST